MQYDLTSFEDRVPTPAVGERTGLNTPAHRHPRLYASRCTSSRCSSSTGDRRLGRLRGYGRREFRAPAGAFLL